MIFLRLLLAVVVMAIGAKLATDWGLTDAHVALKLAFGLAWGAMACLALLYSPRTKGAKVAVAEEIALSDEDIEDLLVESSDVSEGLRAVRG
jgi:hypothetical protein